MNHFTDNQTANLNAQREAISWLVDSRRPGISRLQAIRTLRGALAPDLNALAILNDLENHLEPADH